ncbi:hypothetical protein FACS189419_03270 [Planctomycetales bacterium]|nr:hypothetical protein FACS189419_03270 [Planctomycetales bacterium]
MPGGIELTFQILNATRNQSANAVLETAFESSDETIRKSAGLSLISRKGTTGIEVIIDKFDPSNEYIVSLVNDNRQKIIPGLRSAIVSPDPHLAKNAFRIAISQKFYEVLPSLCTFCFSSASQDSNYKFRQNDLLKFADKYLEALTHSEPHERHLLCNVIFPEMVKIIRTEVRDFRQDGNELTLKMYLRFYPFFADVENDLKQILKISATPIYSAAYRRLLSEPDTYLFQFVSRCLDKYNPPPLVSAVLTKRFDSNFLSYIFKRIKEPLSLETRSNIENLPAIEWLGRIASLYDQFDDEAVQGLVTFLSHISIPKNELETHLFRIFYHGQGKGRQAAFTGLTAFEGERIDKLIWEAAGDKDPAIQIAALIELSNRNVPGMSSRIIQFSGSPNEEVRGTVQKLLPNFKFSWFMDTFEKLDENRRGKIFEIVRNLDPQTTPKLSMMLEAGDEVAVSRALTCLELCPDLIPEVETAACYVLANGTTETLRSKAAGILVNGRSDKSRGSLVQAYHRDPSEQVRDTAKLSLENRPVRWSKKA